MNQAKWLTGIFLPALFTTMLLQACENDLNKVKQISALEVNNPTETTTGVDVIYSDSARVKAHMITPIMILHKVATPYHEMPKGVKIIFFNKNVNQMKSERDLDKYITAIVVADYAITSNNDNTIELRKNVVVSGTDGDTFRSDELIWDKSKKQIYTNQHWQMNKADGTALDGIWFTSNENFTDYHFAQGHGDIVTKGNLGQ